MGWLVIALAALAPEPGSAHPERILVMDVGGAALTREEAGLVRDALATEIAAKTQAEVLSSEDVRRVLDATADKQQMDCATDACLAELGAALGASRVVHGTVSRLGSRLVITLALIDPNNARALGRATAKTDSLEQLYDSVPQTVAELLGQARKRPRPEPRLRNTDKNKGTDVDADGPEVDNGGFPLLTVSGSSLAVLGLAGGLGSGGALFYLFNTAQRPEGDPALKQDYLTYGRGLGVAALVSAAVVVVGGSVLTIGLFVD